MSVHGSATADTVIAIDGMRVNNLCGSGQYSGFYMNDAAIEEVTFTTGAESAEMQNGGLRINSTPKDGGNTFSGTFFAYGAGSGLQADNRTDAMKSGPAAIPQPGIAYHLADQSVVRRTDHAATSCGSTSPTSTRTTRPTSRARTFADGSRAFRQSQGNYSARRRALTWQASQRDKIRFYLDRQFNGEDYNGFNTLPTTTPEASTDAFGPRLGAAGQVDADDDQQAAARSRPLLLHQPYEQNCRREVGPRDLPRLEQTTNRLSGRRAATPFRRIRSWTKTLQLDGRRPATSPARTPSRRGMTMQWGTNSRTFSSNAQINTLVFNAGLLSAPASATNPVPCTACPARSPSSSPTGRRRPSRRSTATSASSCRTPGR